MPKGKYTDSDLASPAQAGKYTDDDLAADTSSQASQDFSAPKGNKEGTYRMAGPKGIVNVPYSKVLDAWKDGKYKIDPTDQKRYVKDKTAEVSGWKSSRTPSMNWFTSSPSIEIPDAYDVVQPTPEAWSKDWVKTKGLSAVRGGIDLLPTVGSITGGIFGAGSAGPTILGVPVAAAAGASVGAGIGEIGRERINKIIFDDPDEGPKKTAENIGIQSAMGGIQEFGGRVITKPLGRLSGYFADTASKSKSLGVPLLPSEAHGTAPTFWENYPKGSIFSAGKMAKFRVLQNAASEREANALADSLSSRPLSVSGSKEEAGKAIRDGIDQHKAAFHRLENYLYKKIDEAVDEQVVKTPVYKQVPTGILDSSGKPIMKTVQAGTSQKAVDKVMPSRDKIVEFAKEQLKKIEAGKSAAGKAPESAYETLLNGIVENKSSNSTYEGMAEARSSWLSKVRDMNSGLSDKEAGFVKKMADLADESMIEAADRSGVPGLTSQIRSANAMVREEHEAFEKKLIKRIVEKENPENIASVLRGPTSNIALRPGIQETRDIMKILPKKLVAPVQRQIMLDTVNDSIAKGTEVFDERKFSQLVLGIGNDRGRILFGSNWNNIRDFAMGIRRISGAIGMTGAALSNPAAVKQAVTSVGRLLLESLGSTGAEVYYGHGGVTGAIGAATVPMASEAILWRTIANALTHPETSGKLVKALQVIAQKSAHAPIGGYNLYLGQNKLEGLRNDEIMNSPTKVQINTPDGQTHFFPNQEEADKWLKDHPDQQLQPTQDQDNEQEPTTNPGVSSLRELREEAERRRPQQVASAGQSSEKPAWTHIYDPISGEIKAI